MLLRVWTRFRWLSLGFAAASITLAGVGCQADLTLECLEGACTEPVTLGAGAGGGGGAGGSGGGPECLACVAETGAQTGEFPCEIETIIKDKCQRCHQDPPQKGAPFPLLTYENTQAEYVKKLIYERMKTAIANNFMPLTPPKLTDAEKETMLAWLCACAPPAGPGEACEP